jgi:large subunit ribosomal protein L33
MAARTGKYIYVKLESTGVYPEGHEKAGQKTGYYYVTTKNPKSQTTTEKFTFKKYDPKIRQHVNFVEKKVK